MIYSILKSKIDHINIPTDYILISLDVSSLFTINEETIEILKNKYHLLKNYTEIPLEICNPYLHTVAIQVISFIIHNSINKFLEQQWVAALVLF